MIEEKPESSSGVAAGIDRWWPWLFFILSCLLAPGLFQMCRTGGYLYYANGADEPSYLIYEFSKSWQGLPRSGQYLVTLMHDCGLSGGWINFVFDLLAPSLYFFFCFRIGQLLGLAKPGRFAVGTLLLPILCTCSNPLFSRLNDFNLGHMTVRYLTSPSGNFLPMARTPEPQFSMVVLAAAVLLGLKRRSFWPVYPCLPFLYPFLAVPTAFVLLSLHLHRRFGWHKWSQSGACCLAFLLVGALTRVGLLLADPPSLQMTVSSYLPMFSATGLLALALWGVLQKHMSPHFRFPALAIALAPSVGCNVQIVSGVLAQPSNFEQYAGCLAVAVLLALGMQEAKQGPSVSWCLLVGSAVLCLVSTFGQVKKVALTPIPSTELLEVLRTDSQSVAVSDGHLGRFLSMVYPKQPFTALHFGRCCPSRDFEIHLSEYLLVRREILRESDQARSYAQILSSLDAGFLHQNQDMILQTVGRKYVFQENNDVEALSRKATGQPPKLIFVDQQGLIIGRSRS